LEHLVLRNDWELSHVRDVHEARTSDETWIPRFASEGGRVLLSGDGSMLRRPHELKAILESRVVVVVMAPPWQNSKRHEQAAAIIWHWPAIEVALLTAADGDCWKVPFAFGKSAALEKMKVNYAKAIQGTTKAS
jgi:hypothetical protein